YDSYTLFSLSHPFFSNTPPPPKSTLFPYTTLFRSHSDEQKILVLRRSSVAVKEPCGTSFSPASSGVALSYRSPRAQLPMAGAPNVGCVFPRRLLLRHARIWRGLTTPPAGK